MKFGTSIDMLSMGAPAPYGKVANNIDTFALTSEEAAYVNSLDAQRYANKEALETVLKAAQDNYQKQASRIITMRDAFMAHLLAKHKISDTDAEDATIENGFFIIDKQSDILGSVTIPKHSIVKDLLKSANSADPNNIPESAHKALALLFNKCGIKEDKDIEDLLGYVLSVKELTKSVEDKLNTGECLGIFSGINDFSSIVLSKNTEGKELLTSAFVHKDVQVMKIFIMANFAVTQKSGNDSLQSSVNLMRAILLALVSKYTNA